ICCALNSIGGVLNDYGFKIIKIVEMGRFFVDFGVLNIR
ncbi:MAG: hypothetical protein JWQ38_592, partial [Flavipsychrobacter sp.]|nr:hypothetical protein [Flavipsychrobacter sp.]